MKKLYPIFLVWIAMMAPQYAQSQNLEEKAVNDMLDAWHQAAAKADAEGFFGRMTPECIYIGTDKTERWLRDELREWSKGYFSQGKAWEFVPIERKVYFDKKGKTAWFNETLNTWMGVCRSSGVVQKEGKEWKLVHYQLAVTIDNDLISGFTSLIKSAPVSSDLRKEVLAPVKQLFDAMRASDTLMLKTAFANGARLSTVGNTKDGKPYVRNDDIQGFAESLLKQHDLYDERILDYDVRVDGNMACIWTPYEFYVGETFSHCGVNAFHLVKTESGWKIWQITDTRKREGCKK